MPSPKGYQWEYWIIPGMLLIAGAVLYFFDPARLAFFPRCPFYTITGYYCPGCGSQRAIHSFLHFRWSDVIRYNALLYPALIFIFYHLLRPLMWKHFRLTLPNILYMKYTPWVVMMVILIFWIVRNIPYEPFSILKPR